MTAVSVMHERLLHNWLRKPNIKRGSIMLGLHLLESNTILQIYTITKQSILF